ncbi:hypothetical protein FQN60_017635, partial [Etheostoma spectabile]
WRTDYPPWGFRQGFFQAGIEVLSLPRRIQGSEALTTVAVWFVDQHETDGHEAFAVPTETTQMIPPKYRYKATSPPPYLPPLFTNEDEHNKSHKKCGRVPHCVEHSPLAGLCFLCGSC